jgi:carboxypeptidase C (cathepsin A)
MLSGHYQAMKLEDYLDEVRDFVSTEYVPALFQGSRLTDAERNGLAEKISSYLGLSRDYVLEKNNRISEDDFLPVLLREKNLKIGRIDGRYTGMLTDDGSDPSSVESDLLLGNAFYAYLTDELNYQTDRPYIPLSNEVQYGWTSPAPPVPWLGGYFSQEEIIRDCMAKNPYLKVWVNCGYYDSATPFYAAEWVYAHVFLDQESKANLSFSFYPSGHMFYVEKASFDHFREQAGLWYQ